MISSFIVYPQTALFYYILALIKLKAKAAVTSTGGGRDTNIYNANGIKAVNLGIGMKKAHTLEEYIAIEDLMKSARIVVEIVKEA
jgi:tripeptide aminopeptidase